MLLARKEVRKLDGPLQAGLYWVLLLEKFVATWPLIIIAFFEVTVISWVYGADDFLGNIRWM